MKRRILKAALAAILILTFALGLTSCAGSQQKMPDAESASGAIENTSITWNYDESTKVLSVNGTGTIPNCESADGVWWKEVRHSVKELRVAAGITEIGDYAFYYLPALEAINIPDGVTRLGKYAFAFCASAKSVNIPDGLASVGEGCFEACTSLGGIFLPASVTELGVRAFAHCSSLKDAIIMAQINNIGSWTFAGCKALEELCFSEAIKEGLIVAADAFEGASKNFESASFTQSTTGEVTLTVNYVFADGTQAAEPVVQVHKRGVSYSVTSPAIEGYNASAARVEGIISRDTVEQVTYTPVEAAVEPTPEQNAAEQNA